jgi:hypothetical protein
MKAIIISLGLLVSLGTEAQNTVIGVNDKGTSSTYVQDGKHVRVTHYHANGAVRETGAFLNNVPDGKWETFAEDGTKTAEINYKDGKRHGEFRTWDAYTNSYLEVQYAEGTMLAANRWVKESGFASSKE